MQTTGSGTRRPRPSTAAQTLSDCQPAGVRFSRSRDRAMAANAAMGISHLPLRAALRISAVLPLPSPAPFPFSIAVFRPRHA